MLEDQDYQLNMRNKYKEGKMKHNEKIMMEDFLKDYDELINPTNPKK